MDETQPTDKGLDRLGVKGLALDLKPSASGKQRLMTAVAQTRKYPYDNGEERLVPDSVTDVESINSPDELRERVLGAVAKEAGLPAVNDQASE